MEDRPLATLVLAEHDNQSLAVGTLCAIKAAFEIKDDDKSLPVSVLLIGYQCQSVLDELNCVQGVAEIIWVDAKGYEHGLAENIAPLISQVAKNYSHILSPASTFGKNVMPRVAALLNVGQLSDVMT
ncbi:electron transfer flavoprotein subunit alpha/FixB family protein, partial [Vibrio sp. Vb2362]|nr:electron transfer flavoprotein subunit alpha/FixB family protein [Vibrio sp. Vb2362]